MDYPKFYSKKFYAHHWDDECWHDSVWIYEYQSRPWYSQIICLDIIDHAVQFERLLREAGYKQVEKIVLTSAKTSPVKTVRVEA